MMIYTISVIFVLFFLENLIVIYVVLHTNEMRVCILYNYFYYPRFGFGP